MNLENLVIAGDFNCCMNLSDRFPMSVCADKSVQSLENLFKNVNLLTVGNPLTLENMGIHIMIKI